ncbi:coiled-coil domain-containing protein 113 isoform X1 [Colius striatus]|uniref:coiled-coil domain-containing protein 113 isoform X1 n=1 Tax=Colius striatus TaxID=57412 RepID=UPI002B1CE4D5|nr:coiled-coil domain-containing protein 113 isoform X1 [Colius striatus]
MAQHGPAAAMAERDPAAVPLPQLRAQTQEESHANALLRTEAELLEKRCRQLEPCSPSHPLLPQAPSAVPQPLQTRGRYKSRFRGSTDYFTGLPVEQKCELAERELTEMKKAIQKMKEDLEKTLQSLEAVIEDIWWADVNKATSDFEKDIIGTISSKEGSITAGEKLLRYMEQKNHQRNRLREKLLFKNILLKDYKKQLQQQLRQEEETRETFSEFHLQQLQVRNAQYRQQMEKKNEEMLQLKLAAGNTIQVFNLYKRKLQDAMATSVPLMKDISQKKELLWKVERAAARVEKQRAKAERVNQQLQRQLSDYVAPSVLSYVQKKMVVADLENSLKDWERKVSIAEMSLRNYRRAWKQVKLFRLV